MSLSTGTEAHSSSPARAYSAAAYPQYRGKRETEGQMWPDVSTISWLETTSPAAFSVVPL